MIITVPNLYKSSHYNRRDNVNDKSNINIISINIPMKLLKSYHPLWL